MIKLNLRECLRSKGIEIQHGDISDLKQFTDSNRITIRKYLYEELTSVDLNILSKICEWFCQKYHHLERNELLMLLLQWESFSRSFEFSDVTYFVGQEGRSDSIDGPIHSQNDVSVANALNKIHKDSAPKIVYVQNNPKSNDAQPTDNTANDISVMQVRVHIGSPTKNCSTERTLANEFFGAKPFSNHTKKVPIRFTTRDNQRVASCIISNRSNHAPGLAWLNESLKFEDFPFQVSQAKVIEDAGFVMVKYTSNRNTNLLDLVIFGYSGSATRALGNALLKHVDRINWPPTEIQDGCFADIYAFQFTAEKTNDRAASINDDDIQVSFRGMEKSILRKYIYNNTNS